MLPPPMVTNVVVAVTVEMVYVAERSEQLELHDQGRIMVPPGPEV